jgi:hypothetical protein
VHVCPRSACGGSGQADRAILQTVVATSVEATGRYQNQDDENRNSSSIIFSGLYREPGDSLQEKQILFELWGSFDARQPVILSCFHLGATTLARSQASTCAKNSSLTHHGQPGLRRIA